MAGCGLYILSLIIGCIAADHIDLEAMTYLENYGYIASSSRTGSNLRSAQELRASIRTMQKYAGLPETGIVDARTVAKMKSRRCGLPDVLHKRPKRFAIYGASSKWNKNVVTWSLVKSSKSISEAAAKRAFSRAFDLWSKGSSNILKFESIDSEEADIKIGFFVKEHGCGRKQAFDGPGSKLAHAFSPPNGNIHFDDEENWISDDPDLFWTALHEIGHSLGFAHTADERSIMFPYYQDHGANFQLPEVDRRGLLYLYGGNNSNTNKLEEKVAEAKVTETAPSKRKEEEENNVCNTNIDAIASIRGNVFIFKNNVFWWLRDNLEMVRDTPIPVSQYFIGFPEQITKVDAVYERKSDQMIMFFAGKNYWLFSANNYHAGPRPLTDLGLPYDLDHVDAVSDWANNGKAYIFAGSIYWKLDDAENHVLAGFPQDIGWLRSIPMNMDGAFTWHYDSAMYFFKANQFWKVNHDAKVETGYPKFIGDVWFSSLNCSNVVKADLLYRSSAKGCQSYNLTFVILGFVVVYIIIMVDT